MGGIAGILNLDGRPVDNSQLESITIRSANRGIDGIGYWKQGNIGFGLLAQRLTPTAQIDSFPCLHSSGQYAITLHGRIDNRTELMSLLGFSPDSVESLDDASLILECYIRWGVGAPYKILGDFAFAIWDKPKR
ncbi:MAG: asparagine synthetase B, partial [Arenicellales bacterium]